MCEKAVEVEPQALEFVPDHFKALGMCENSVKDDSSFFYSLSLIGL